MEELGSAKRVPPVAVPQVKRPQSVVSKSAINPPPHKSGEVVRDVTPKGTKLFGDNPKDPPRPQPIPVTAPTPPPARTDKPVNPQEPPKRAYPLVIAPKEPPPRINATISILPNPQRPPKSTALEPSSIPKIFTGGTGGGWYPPPPPKQPLMLGGGKQDDDYFLRYKRLPDYGRKPEQPSFPSQTIADRNPQLRFRPDRRIGGVMTIDQLTGG